MKRKALKKKNLRHLHIPRLMSLSTYDSHVGVSTFDSCAMMDDGKLGRPNDSKFTS